MQAARDWENGEWPATDRMNLAKGGECLVSFDF